MFSFVGRLAVALLVVAEVSYAEPSIRDNRDGKIYKAMSSGSLNWFTDNLSLQKKVSFRDDGKNLFFDDVFLQFANLPLQILIQGEAFFPQCLHCLV